MFNVRHLLCALEVKEAGTLTQAAQSVYLTQSALTQGINKLELQLGHQLFSRTRSGMFVTSAGEQFLNRVNRAFNFLHGFAAACFASDKSKQQAFVRNVSARQLQALVTVTELQSYTAAAVRLGLTQPTLHKTIRDLQDLCEQSLFQRAPKGVEPNWRTRHFSRFASLYFAELRQGVDELNEFSGLLNGALRIGSLPLALTSIVPQSVLGLLSIYPLARVSVVDGPYEEQLSALLHGQLDVIVGALRYPAPSDDILQQTLFTDELSLVMRNGHPLAGMTRLSDQTLAELQWIAPRIGSPARKVFGRLFSEHQFDEPQDVIECSALVAIRGMLLNSDRVALLPARQVAPEVDAGLLAICPVQLKGTSRDIGYTLRKDWHPTRIQSRYLQCLSKQFSG